ncbi:Udp-glucose 6-dehydrogenase [Thalictrum thalictroides]|uniref:UDP-glucose 6-dehydrogenase n=1 Tax=Thalictrum thalictroides TaxID=46969 RepID=A0A7J6X8P9_THATH|nr:Udp-glucose 6-dehydrogenase [Thalictrum thalictroides]
MNQNPNQQNQDIYNIACLGSGYTAGLTMIMMAFHCDVVITMLDVDNEDIDDWEAGIIPFDEPNFEHMFDQVRNVRLMFGQSNNIAAALNTADFIVIAVDNPIQRIKKKNTLNLTKWKDSWEQVAMHAPDKLNPTVVYNPEFYSLGTAFNDLQNPRQVIFGGDAQILNGPLFHNVRKLMYWVDQNAVFRYHDIKSVVLAKLGINGLLASKLSILNSIASISAAVEADMNTIMEIMGRDQRLGPTYLTPGIGFGGPSLERDTRLLCHVAQNKGLLKEEQIYTKVLENNEAAEKRFVNMVVDKMNGTTNKTIAIFGLASKHGISDLTNSPAIQVCKLLLDHDVYLRIYDLYVPNAHILGNFRRGVQERVVVATSPVQAATNASAICLLTDCDAYQHGGIQFYNQLFAVMTQPSYIFNGRQNSGINWQDVANIGFSIHAVGRPSRGLGFE